MSMFQHMKITLSPIALLESITFAQMKATARKNLAITRLMQYYLYTKGVPQSVFINKPYIIIYYCSYYSTC